VRSTIETREIITLKVGSLCLTGTYHRPAELQLPSERDRPDQSTGLLFLTGLADPRVGEGDSAVQWADSLARAGYSCFRVDLPGLGDSEGEVARTEAAFMPAVNAGCFSDSVCSVVNQLAERFHLENVVLFGHCSGAVTAIYAAAGNRRISGLILLDPYFHLQENEIKKDSFLNWHWRIIAMLVGSATARAFAVRLHSTVRQFYRDQIKALENPNRPLIQRWNQLNARRLPILIFRSPGSLPKQGEPDFIGSIQRPSDRDCPVSVKLVEGATHDFGSRDAREVIFVHSREWLNASFS
jgi:pimeloyl-ACP methyl ester carboxylesterase